MLHAGKYITDRRPAWQGRVVCYPQTPGTPGSHASRGPGGDSLS